MPLLSEVVQVETGGWFAPVRDPVTAPVWALAEWILTAGAKLRETEG